MNKEITHYKIDKLINGYKKQLNSALTEYYIVSEDEYTELDANYIEELDIQINVYKQFIIDLESLKDE